jgi:hypothetical protein
VSSVRTRQGVVRVRCRERASGQLDIAKATVFLVNMVYLGFVYNREFSVHEDEGCVCE